MLGSILGAFPIGSKQLSILVKIEPVTYERQSQTEIKFQVPLIDPDDTDIILERGICYKLSSSPGLPTVDDNKIFETGPFDQEGFEMLLDLATNTEYKFRPYVIGKYGIIYGDEIIITTSELNNHFRIILTS